MNERVCEHHLVVTYNNFYKTCTRPPTTIDLIKQEVVSFKRTTLHFRSYPKWEVWCVCVYVIKFHILYFVEWIKLLAFRWHSRFLCFWFEVFESFVITVWYLNIDNVEKILVYLAVSVLFFFVRFSSNLVIVDWYTVNGIAKIESVLKPITHSN